MKVEHFVYGMIKGYGIKLLPSPSLKELLNGDIIDYLCKLEKPKEYSNLWPNGVITITKVSKVQDEFGRNGVWNSTIAMRLMDYLAFTEPLELLKDYFVERLEKPEKLEPIRIDTK